MAALKNVHLTGADDDLYSGYNEYNPIIDQDIANDQAFQQALVKTSHGRRPMTSKAPGFGGRLTTAAAGARGRTAIATARPITAAAQGTAARPMTAVRGAGYTSHGRKGMVDPLKQPSSTTEMKVEENQEDKCKQMEKKVTVLLEKSIMEYHKSDYKQALETAKEAGRKERAAVKLREQSNLVDSINLDLTFSVLLNLAHQYVANEAYNEALNTFQVIVKNKTFQQAGRLKVNIGNIYFKKKDYDKAIKYYRMALDQIPNVQKLNRIKILHNIGVAFVRLSKYDDAISSFELCMEEKPEFRTGLNLILCAYTLEDRERMKEGFQRLLQIPLEVDDDEKYVAHNNDPHENLIIEAIKNDTLRQWEKSRKQEAERTILTAAKIIAPAISSTFSEGYAWCLDEIKGSAYADLASDLEINKAIQYLRQRDISAATEVLKNFEKKDSKVASAAATNLSFLYFLQKDLQNAAKYADQAITNDRYNPNALVNRGNVFYASGDFEKAREFYHEALSNEATCVEALYNLGLTSKKMQKLEEALECFYKLNAILRSNVQVMLQIGSIYESLEDTTRALEWYSVAQNLAPTDPGILAKLGEVYDREGDKSQAFQCHYDSYRYFPSNIDVIEWLGAYYVDAQFSEKAVNYFERAALIQPGEVKWQLMIAGCHRRSGNYQKALETYKSIHRKFPDNTECLKSLVRIATDLGLPEANEYTTTMKKAERVKQLREEGQRAGGSAPHRSSIAQRGGSANSLTAGRPSSSRSNLRTASAKVSFNADDDEPYHMSNRSKIDTSYVDPVGPAPERPKTGAVRRHDDHEFDDEDIGDDLLPD